MNCIDYRTMEEEARVMAALKAAIDGGISIHKAISIEAISKTESNFLWTLPRSKTLLYDDKGQGCWSCRLVVGWEPHQIKIAERDGQPVYKRVLHTANSADAAGLKYVLDNKLAFQSKDGLEPTAALGGDNDATARWLEWVIGHRKANLLINFSIGPTQMHLIWSDMALPYRGASAVPAQGWFTTWDDLFGYYTSHSVPAVLKRITYLDRQRVNKKAQYPSEDPTDSVGIVFWLVQQIGNPADATKYYNNSYKQNLNRVMNIARKAGFIN